MFKIHSKFLQRFFTRQQKQKLGINQFLKKKSIILEEELSDFKFKVFADEAICKVYAGEGGNGKQSRVITRAITTGNYDGGNGGKGGDIIFKAASNIDYNLSQFSNHEFFSAEGHDGRIKFTQGKNAKALQVSLPIGTQVYEIKEDSKQNLQWKLLKNLDSPGDSVLVAKGGLGGLGSSDKNFHPLRMKGNPGQQKEIGLLLRIPNDIALIGMSCSGKSFLMSQLTQAISKISSFKNNTKIPILGKLRFLNNRIYTVLDLPPLKHREGQDFVDRWDFSQHLHHTKLILVVIDAANKNFFEQVLSILKYLRKINIENKNILFVLNKIDLLNEQQKTSLRYKFNSLDFQFCFVSALEGQGLVELLDQIKKLLPEFKKYNQKFQLSKQSYQNKCAYNTPQST